MNDMDKPAERKNNRLPGIIIVLIQAALTVYFIIGIYQTHLLAGKYFLIPTVTLIVLAGIFFLLQLPKRKAINVVGMVLSAIMIIALIGGCYYVTKANRALNGVSGVDNGYTEMVVLVRKDDKASRLQDVKDEIFTYTKDIDSANNKKMMKQIDKELNKTVKTKTYSTLDEEARDLLHKKTRVMVTNSAFLDVIDDTVPHFSRKVKVIYKYDIPLAYSDNNTNPEGVFQVYISGIDTDGSIKKTSRSDVNIIMTVNTNTHQIMLTSTPRDYFVPIPGISHGKRDKLTHAGIYGIDASERTLEKLYGIDLTYYYRVNFTSLVKVVDALGGVDVQSDYDFTAGGYTFHQGTNHLDGKAALAFSRERHAFKDGDNQRGRDQEYVLTGIINKMLSPSVITHANALMNSLNGSFETDMSKEQFAGLLADQLEDGTGYIIRRQAVTGTGAMDYTYSMPRTRLYVMRPDMKSVNKAKKQIQQVVDGQ